MGSRDHHLGGFDDGQSIVAAAQLERANGVSGDEGGQELIADAQSHLRQEAIDSHFVDVAAQAVARAEAVQRSIVRSGAGSTPSFRLLSREQAIYLGFRDAVVSTFRSGGPHPTGVHPSLERRVGDAEPLGGRSDREETHLEPVRTTLRILSPGPGSLPGPAEDLSYLNNMIRIESI
jgi:hypothetical protein